MSTFQVARRGESKQRGGGGHNAEHMQVQEYHLYEHIPPSFLCFEQGEKCKSPHHPAFYSLELSGLLFFSASFPRRV